MFVAGIEIFFGFVAGGILLVAIVCAVLYGWLAVKGIAAGFVRLLSGIRRSAERLAD